MIQLKTMSESYFYVLPKLLDANLVLQTPMFCFPHYLVSFVAHVLLIELL